MSWAQRHNRVLAGWAPLSASQVGGWTDDVPPPRNHTVQKLENDYGGGIAPSSCWRVKDCLRQGSTAEGHQLLPFALRGQFKRAKKANAPSGMRTKPKNPRA